MNLILQAIIAIPQIIKLLMTLWESIQKTRTDKLIEDTKKAVLDGDTIKVEEGLGSPRAGKPSGIDGGIVRDKGTG